MNITNAIQEIESIPFEIKYTVANSLNVLLMAWEEDTIIEAMIEMIQKQSENQQLILDRIKLLSKDRISLGTMHPHDMIIAIYLYILHRGKSLGAEVAALNIILKTKGLYWARKLVERFLTEIEDFALTDNQYAVIHSGTEDFVLTDNQFTVIQTYTETNYSVTTIIAA